MDLQHLKNNLNIIEIARELGLQPDKNGKCLCPFHKEKTASLQFSEKKQIATCFSSKCDAGTMDVIALVQKFSLVETKTAIHPKVVVVPNYQELFTTLQTKLAKSKKAKDYLQYRFLDHEKLEVGYNPSTNKEYKHLKYCVVFPLKNGQNEIVSLYGRSILPQAKAKHFYTTNRKGLYPRYPKADTRKLILTESIIDATTLEH